MLELEVVHLEQYLLSLYRQAFDQHVSSMSPITRDEKLTSPLTSPRLRRVKISRADTKPNKENPALQVDCQSNTNLEKDQSDVERLVDSGVHRCQSSLSQRSTVSTRTSPPAEPLGRAVRACYSQPLSMMEVPYFTTHNLETFI